MDLNNIRDFAMYAAIFGVFAFAWFGWAQENPPTKLRIWLGLGSAVSALIAGTGGYLAYSNWNAHSALNNEGAYEVFGVIVITEILLSLVGSIILIKQRKDKLVAPWIAFVVAIHFIPLAVIFSDLWLYMLAALIVCGIALSLHVRSTKIQINTLVCLLTATILFAFAVRGLLLYLLASYSTLSF